MGTIVKGLFKNIWQPQLQLVRYRNKINITKPRPPHYERALLETVCVPYFVLKKRPQHIPNYELCNASVKKKRKVEDHPLKIILANERLQYFQKSKLVAFFHMNSLTAEEKFQYQLRFKRNGMKLLFFGKSILETSFKDTIYEPALVLYNAPTATAFSPEADINSLLKIHKKVPKLILMAAIVEKKLLSITELKSYAIFKDITQARTALVQVLNSSSQNLVQQINHHPNTLVELLNQHKKLLKE